MFIFSFSTYFPILYNKPHRVVFLQRMCDGYQNAHGKIETSVSRSKSNVFLRKDFKACGGYDQIGRVLRDLIANGKLVKVEYGIYARSEPISFTENSVPVIPLMEIGMEDLGIEIFPSQ